jgi:hypothetical protein
MLCAGVRSGVGVLMEDGRWKLTGNVLEMLIKYPPQAKKILACLGVFGRLESVYMVVRWHLLIMDEFNQRLIKDSWTTIRS